MFKIFKLDDKSLVLSNKSYIPNGESWDLYFTAEPNNIYMFRFFNWSSPDSYRHGDISLSQDKQGEEITKIFSTFVSQMSNSIVEPGAISKLKKGSLYSDNNAQFDKKDELSIKVFIEGLRGISISMSWADEILVIEEERILDHDIKSLQAVKNLFISLKEIAEEKPKNIEFFDFTSEYNPDGYDRYLQTLGYGSHPEKTALPLHQLRLTKKNR